MHLLSIPHPYIQSPSPCSLAFRKYLSSYFSFHKPLSWRPPILQILPAAVQAAVQHAAVKRIHRQLGELIVKHAKAIRRVAEAATRHLAATLSWTITFAIRQIQVETIRGVVLLKSYKIPATRRTFKD